MWLGVQKQPIPKGITHRFNYFRKTWVVTWNTMDLQEQDNSKNSSVKALTMMQINLFMWLHFLMPVLVVAIILNMIYTILCVVCLTTTCFKNTHFRTAAHPLNNDQRFIFLLVWKMWDTMFRHCFFKNWIQLSPKNPKRGKVLKQEETI
jgi:hypothetical protein